MGGVCLPDKRGKNRGNARNYPKDYLAILKQRPSAGRREFADIMGDIAENGVKYHLDRLKSEGRIRRLEPTGGEWQVVGEDDE